jgi:membrane-bound inhibitor of C-type lysozyme
MFAGAVRQNGTTKLIILRMNTFANAGCGVALVTALAGCGSFNIGSFSIGNLNPWSGPVERVQSAPVDATTYTCEGGKRLVVRYLSADKTVMIVFPEREFRLDAAPGGANYTNGGTTLTAQGDEVALEEAGAKTYTSCKKAAG